jgi:hypothetical protein
MKFQITITESSKLKPASYFKGDEITTRYNEELEQYYASDDDGKTWHEVSRKTAVQLGH